MGKIKEKDCSAAWWAELEDIEDKNRDLNWCCKLILKTGFEEFIQNEIGVCVSLRFGVNYCPHCGKLLKRNRPPISSNTCCYLFRDIGLEGMQFEENCTNLNNQDEIIVHRIFMNYCFNCGREMRRESGDNPNSWAGECAD
ncbi:hypothetical protein BMS3Abin07_02355 [bacterium BMS3Abin07]|nr:hypothetical protein BMS3Abin07_02355 [bacterium BMS3Abin07]GBE31380.1 hypothetical protein BMS3Bbin05_00280 [bacterium BMS3Bbin05]HDO21357.1 hypothetical protein [Nitrospirota bacterium]